MSRIMRKSFFAYAKTKTQISFAVTAKLISAFVFATRIVQFLFYLKLKFQVSSHLLWLYSPVCVGPGRKPEDRFSHNEAHMVSTLCCRSHIAAKMPMKNKSQNCKEQNITKTSPCNDPLTRHFYIVKLGFTGVYIIFLFLF